MAEKTDKPLEKKGAHSFNRSKGPDQSTDKVVQKRPSQMAIKPMLSASGKEIRGVVRLAGRDLRGNLPIRRAIISVRGIGINFGN